jgi:hypothetical protein
MARVETLWVDEAGTPHITPAKLEDKSPGGACIRIREEIAVGSTITIQWTRGHLTGAVAYCKRQGGEYVLGIRRDASLDDDSK